MADHPPGTIGVIGGDLARFARFESSLHALAYPKGTILHRSAGVNIAGNANRIIRALQGEWLWLLGDDHTFTPDTLMRLLDHQVDIVAPLVLRRAPPYSTVISRETPDGLKNVPPDQVPLGLSPVDAIGGAGLLVRAHVFQKMADPWFEYGRIVADEMSEDLYFCRKARAAGFTVWLDADTVLGHLQPITVYPHRRPDGTVAPRLDLGNDVSIVLGEGTHARH